jgi:hypothetical protein
MAHRTFKVLDSDFHINEPPDLGPRYIDPAFPDRASSGLTEDIGDLRLGGGGVLPGTADLRAEQAEDPLGQLRSALQRGRRGMMRQR